LVALAPVIGNAVSRLAKARGLDGAPVRLIGERLGDVRSTVGTKIEESGGATRVAKEAGRRLLPGGNGGSSGAPGVGSGRRMPVQQAIDVAVPLRTAYNQWTQFEDWPKFMHRVDRVTQQDETHVSFDIKIWGLSKSFEAEILEQHPDERIMWRADDGLSHAGVVTFHELSARLTRIELNLDVEPGSLVEKAGSGMRHVKRAVRADMARFKAQLEMEGKESGAWRGVIEGGKVKPRRRSSSSGGRSRSSSKRKTTASGGAGAKGRAGSSRRRRGSSRTGRSSGSTRRRSGSRS
jgi:uncharacterized membrane protein